MVQKKKSQEKAKKWEKQQQQQQSMCYAQFYVLTWLGYSAWLFG